MLTKKAAMKYVVAFCLFHCRNGYIPGSVCVSDVISVSNTVSTTVAGSVSVTVSVSVTEYSPFFSCLRFGNSFSFI